ncbi:MAG: hypothetical protein AB7O59_00095 [Pirellulales bacterium]
MNPVDAYRLLSLELVAFRALSYADLAQMIGQCHTRRAVGSDGTEYAIEINVRWRDVPNGAIVVAGSIIEDGGPEQPLENRFVVSPP